MAIRDRYRLLPVDEWLTLLCRLVHTTLLASAIALDVTCPQAIEALGVLVLLRPLLDVHLLLPGLHMGSPVPLLTLPFLPPLLFAAPICMGIAPPAPSRALATSFTSSRTFENVCTRARSSDASTYRLACVQCHQPELQPVLDACNRLLPQTLLVKPLKGRLPSSLLVGQTPGPDVARLPGIHFHQRADNIQRLTRGGHLKSKKM